MIPGSFRIRPIYPIIDRHLGCRAVLDLERSKLIPVEDENRLHVASVLDSGNPDEVLLAWMTDVGLITAEAKPKDEGAAPGPIVVESPGEPAARLLDFGAHLEWHFDRLEETSLAELEALLVDNGVLRRHGLVVGAAGAVNDADLLLRFLTMVEGAPHRETLGLHVTVSAGAVTLPVADALERLQAKVTIRWNLSPEVDPDAEAERVAMALDRLQPVLPEEPQVDSDLGPDDRLLDLWKRARQKGVRRLEGIQVEHQFLGSIHYPGTVSVFAEDLAVIVDEMFQDLAAGQSDCLYQPVARVVSYLIQQERSKGRRTATQVGREAELASCSTCWVKEYCSRSRSLVDPAGSGRRFLPHENRCDFWRAEIHAGMLLFDRLREVDRERFLDFPVEENAGSDFAVSLSAFDLKLDYDLPS
ncbi:MAG: hypothetical protein AAF481_14825 [Acidobacteriota bacterium]